MAILALALAACAGGSGTPAPTAGRSDAPIPAADCPALDLLSPAGEAVDLTGRWRAGHDAATYYLRQVGSCLWITGFSSDAGTPSEGPTGRPLYSNAFFGHLQPDFTFDGWWADTPWGQESGAGTVTWEVEFAEVDGQTSVTLRVTDADDFPLFLVRPESSAELHLRLQEGEPCVAAVSEEAQRYEVVVESHEWNVTAQFGLAGPGNLLLGGGDELQASGELARGIGLCGPGTLLIADVIEPTTP
jgi:hypothetical protein